MLKNKYLKITTVSLLISITLIHVNIFAQQTNYIQKGEVKYEVKINNHKNLLTDRDDNNPEGNMWVNSMLEYMPKFSTYTYSFKFADNKSMYKYESKVETSKKMWNEETIEDDVWFADYEARKYTNQKNIFGEIYKLEDSLINLKWKIIPNDNREIIGFNCKKAQTILYDSVYIFAYYTDVITIPGGPMSLQGLPGLILGITIPRLNTSCVAISYNPLVNASTIIAAKNGKVKPVKELQLKIKDATKQWGSYGQKAIWQGFL